MKQPKPTEEQVEQAEEEDSKPFRIGSILVSEGEVEGASSLVGEKWREHLEVHGGNVYVICTLLEER